MGWFTGVVLYLLIWWTALFAVLPLGTQPVAQADEHTGWRGAPERVRLARVVLITTAAAALIWLCCFAVISSPILSFRHGWLALQD